MTELQVWVIVGLLIGLLVANVLDRGSTAQTRGGNGTSAAAPATFRPNTAQHSDSRILHIWSLHGGLVGLIVYALWKESQSQFVIGALVGLLGSGLTGLAGLGTTLMNEGTPVPSGSNASKEDL